MYLRLNACFLYLNACVLITMHVCIGVGPWKTLLIMFFAIYPFCEMVLSNKMKVCCVKMQQNVY